jgi:hypothetical protein
VAEIAATLVVVAAFRLCQREVAGIVGSTTLNIAAAPRIGIAQQRTGLEVRRAVIPSPTARRVRDNRSADKAAILAATAPPAAASATAWAETTLAVAVVATALATVPVEVEQTALAVGISRAVVVETGTPSEEVPEDSTDQALAPTAPAVPLVWGLAQVAVLVVAADGADRANTRVANGGAQHEIKIYE